MQEFWTVQSDMSVSCGRGVDDLCRVQTDTTVVVEGISSHGWVLGAAVGRRRKWGGGERPGGML